MKKNIFFCLLLIVLLGACTNDQDENFVNIISERDESMEEVDGPFVSKALALEAANLFLSKNGESSRTTKSTQSIKEIRDMANQPLMYIINYTGGGFIIISATKEYYPILAYSDDNFFEADTRLGGISEWINETKDNIEARHLLADKEMYEIEYLWRQYTTSSADISEKAHKTKSRSDMSNAFYKRITELRQLYPGFQFIPLSQCSAGMFAYNGASIISDLKQRADQNSSPYEFTLVAFKNNNTYKKEGPLLTTIWNQDAPYNALCPKNTLAGCVAIAMAQIMRYHKHPSGYNWNNMPDNTATYDTQSLIYEIGKAVKMDYGQNGSSSDINKAFIALASKYNYSPSKGDFNHEKVSKEIFTYKRPVYMRGGSSQILLWDYDGHAWVCDGADKKEYETSYFVEYLRGSAPNYYMYNNDYYSHNNHGSCGYGTLHFHMNWGWGGTNNGWFLFSSANSGNGDYKYGRQDMYIIPNK